MPVVPRSGLVAAWANAWLQGLVSPDDAAAAIAGAGVPHRVAGAPGEDGPVSWPVALGRLRAAGATGFRVCLPAPGDVSGLPGPASFNEAALAAGEAVLVAGATAEGGLGLVPQRETGSGTTWFVLPTSRRLAPPAVSSLAEADRALAEGLREATAALAALDVARGREQLSGQLRSLEQALDRLRMPPGTSSRALQVLHRALRLRVLVEYAAADDGAAMTAGQAAARAAALQPLDGLARHAAAAAFHAAVEPVPQRRR
ncbi:MAG: hypothetical protein EPO13_07090 [Actinomycetota bacterium]|nr:MAG: hypothetical protein EPO13_07090 [Actinomycetota bacterium]